ncbi:MAG: hypothetical protein IKI11_09670 [Neisseriaceae bacterium]|nr:hypothetical protein [Neisseriaceae bacterium]
MQQQPNGLHRVVRHIHQHSPQMMIAIEQGDKTQVLSANYIVHKNCYYVALPMKYVRACLQTPQTAVLLLETIDNSQLSWVAVARIVAHTESRFPYLRMALQARFNNACFMCELCPQQGRAVSATGQIYDIDAQDLYAIEQPQMVA